MSKTTIITYSSSNICAAGIGLCFVSRGKVTDIKTEKEEQKMKITHPRPRESPRSYRIFENINIVLTITCQTMITLNKLAKRCLETAMRKGKINNYTSRRAFYLIDFCQMEGIA